MPYFLIHIQTALQLLCVGNAVILCLLAAYARGLSGERPFRLFTAGKVLQALAWLLLTLRGLVPDAASVVVGNLILLAGFTLEALALVGILRASRGMERALVLMGGLGMLVFLGGLQEPGLRVGLASLVTALLFGPAAFHLLRSGEGSRLRLLLGAVYAAFCLALGLRAALALLVTPGFSLFSANYIQTVTFLTAYGLLLVGGMAFLLLIKERDDRRLAESEDKYRNLVEKAREAILIIQDRQVVFANRQASSLFAVPMTDVLGAGFMDYVHPEDRDLVLSRHAQRLEGGAPESNYDIRCVGRDGHLTWVSLSATRILWKGEPAVLSLLTDITDRKRLEQEREEMIGELQGALAEVRTLSGLIPICASCKKIRDDQGYWNELETYLVQRTEAEFTHGICPECRVRWLAHQT